MGRADGMEGAGEGSGLAPSWLEQLLQSQLPERDGSGENARDLGTALEVKTGENSGETKTWIVEE